VWSDIYHGHLRFVQKLAPLTNDGSVVYIWHKNDRAKLIMEARRAGRSAKMK
jgi:hypothetical protein